MYYLLIASMSLATPSTASTAHAKSSRRLEEMPPEANVERLCEYSGQRTRSLLCDEYLIWTTKEFTEVRDVALITLFNG